MIVSNQDLEEFKILLINEDLGAARKILSCNFRCQVVLSNKTIRPHFRAIHVKVIP